MQLRVDCHHVYFCGAWVVPLDGHEADDAAVLLGDPRGAREKTPDVLAVRLVQPEPIGQARKESLAGGEVVGPKFPNRASH